MHDNCQKLLLVHFHDLCSARDSATTITGSSSAAQQQLSYLYDVSNRLGLQFQSTAESAKTFFAAGKLIA